MSSKVRHFFLSGKLCLGIFSASTIPSGSEITIPFEFGFDEYHSLIDCACAQDNCAVMKYNHKLQNQNHESNSQKRFKAHDDDSNSGPPQKLSPLGASLGNSQSLQVKKVKTKEHFLLLEEDYENLFLDISEGGSRHNRIKILGSVEL